MKAGYKTCDVGEVPIDWDVVLLRDLEREGSVRLGRGRVISRRDIANSPGDWPIYSSSVHNDGLFGHFGQYMFDEELVTWSVDGGGNFFYRPRHRFSITNVCGFIRVLSTKLNARFLAYQLQALHALQVFDYTLKAHPSVIRGTYFLPLPPLPEQRAIATALSDADALIAALDRLIAKKRAIKQGAMQRLLTGEVRLEGFEGEWTERRLGDVVDVDPEQLPNNLSGDYTFKYISLEDVDRGTLRSSTVQVYRTAPSRARRRIRPHDVLVATVRPNLGSHLLFLESGTDWVCSTGFAVIRCRDADCHSGYVFAHLFAGKLRRQIETLITGSNYPAISSRDVRQLEIPLPSFAEQEAIATVLSDMDAEITALERQRDKTRALRQGMMQDLLTGRVRLVETGKKE